jgi:hypothetical protein
VAGAVSIIAISAIGTSDSAGSVAEAELLARVATGDRGDPLGALVDRYGGPLFGFGQRLLGDRGMAEELV